MKDLQACGLEFKEMEVTDVKVRIHGDSPVLTATTRTLTSRHGQDATSHFWLVAGHAAEQGRPRLVHFQRVLLRR